MKYIGTKEDGRYNNLTLKIGSHYTFKELYDVVTLLKDNNICRIFVVNDNGKVISEMYGVDDIRKGYTINNNTGYYNTGNCNTGRYNTGYYNTGNCNTGSYNTGSGNTGSRNNFRNNKFRSHNTNNNHES